MSENRKINHLKKTIDRLLHQKKELNKEIIYSDNENVNLRSLIWALVNVVQPIVDRYKSGLEEDNFSPEFTKELINLQKTLNQITDKFPF